MFDIGLLELSLVMLVGLMVLGPARLPEVVRSLTKASRWLKKIITSTKKEMSEFIEDLTVEHLESIMVFFNTMPKVRHFVEVTNPKTKVKSEVVLEGLQTFLG